MSSRMRTAPRAASEETKNQIKAAAQMLFARNGIDAVTVQQIVDAAGQRNNAALYYHFRTKEELIRQMVVDGAAVLEARRREMLDDLEKWFSRFIAMPDPEDYRLLVLWTISTHLAVELYTTARLLIDSSAEKVLPSSLAAITLGNRCLTNSSALGSSGKSSSRLRMFGWSRPSSESHG